MRRLTAMRACALLAITLALTHCAALRPRPKDPGLTLLPPAGAGFTRTLTQTLTVHRGEHTLQSLVVAQISPTSDRLVALGPLGNRVLTLVWDGKHLSQERDPSLPAEFPAQLVLRDLQLAYWTPASVRAGLPSGWTLEEGDHERVIKDEGEAVISIHFAGDPFKDSIDFEHKTLGYRLTIEQVPPTP